MIHQPSSSYQVSVTPLYHKNTLSLSFWSFPTYDASYPLYESPMQSNRQWHHQKMAEKSAGLDSVPSVSLAECAICGIHIGIGYFEQEMYLYSVEKKQIRFSDDSILFVDKGCFDICGGCARRRNLPRQFCIIHPGLWETTFLLNGHTDPLHPEQYTDMLTAIQRYIQWVRETLAEGEKKSVNPHPVGKSHPVEKSHPVTKQLHLPEKTAHQVGRFSLSKIGYTSVGSPQAVAASPPKSGDNRNNIIAK